MNDTRRRWLFRIADALDVVPFAVEVATALACLAGGITLLMLWL